MRHRDLPAAMASMEPCVKGGGVNLSWVYRVLQVASGQRSTQGYKDGCLSSVPKKDLCLHGIKTGHGWLQGLQRAHATAISAPAVYTSE